MKNVKVEYILIAIIAIISIGIARLYERFLIDIDRAGLWVLVGLFFAVVIYFIIRNLTRKKSDPYEIINPLLITFTLYSMMLPLNYLINIQHFGFAASLRYISKPVIFQYIIICLIGLIGLLIGYYSPFANHLVPKLPAPSITNRELKIAGCILLVLGVLSFATNVAGYGGISSYIKVGYSPQRYVIEREALAFGSGLELIGISSIILMLATFKDKKKIWFILLFVIFLWFLSIALLIGQRRYIVYLTLMAFIIFNYWIFRVKLKWFLILGFLAYAFFFIYAHTRTIWAEIGIIKGFIETYNFVVKHPNLLLPFIGGEFIPPAKAIIEVLSDNTFQFKYGSSYLVGLIRIIPRVGKLWPEALQRLALWRLVTYYPGLTEKGHGFVFFTVAEGFVNFGHLGVFLHMFLYGFIAKSIFLYLRQNSTNTFVLLTYAAVFSLMLFEGIHAEFGQVLWYAAHTYIGPLFIIIIIMKITNRSVSKK